MDITPVSGTAARDNAQAHHVHKNLLEGIHFKFPTFKHDHPPVVNVNQVAEEQLTTGQKIADKVASTVGSWPFIIIQSIILAIWLLLNSLAWAFKWDPYPFILLNLALSFQAAYSAPFVMMSQNRQAEKDRLTAQNDYICDTKGEEEIRHIMEHLDHQDEIIIQILTRIEAQHQRIEAQHQEVLLHLSQLDPEMARRLGTDLQQVSEDITEIGGNS